MSKLSIGLYIFMIIFCIIAIVLYQNVWAFNCLVWVILGWIQSVQLIKLSKEINERDDYLNVVEKSLEKLKDRMIDLNERFK